MSMRSKLGKSLSLLLIFSLLLTFAAPALASSGQPSQKPLPNRSFDLSDTGEYIVKYRQGVTMSTMNAKADNLGANVLEQKSEKMLLKVDNAHAIETLSQLAADPNVEYVEPNLVLHATEVSGNDLTVTKVVYDGEETYRYDQWGLGAIDAPDAWGELDEDLDPVTVAVIDTGVDYSHPELADRVDTVNDYDYVNNDTDAMDDNSHGTHVAGIIAAEQNEQGIIGVAEPADVVILPLKVLDEKGSGNVFNIANAIWDAVDIGADIINLSLGGPGYSQTMADAVEYAVNNGVLVVAAAGNDGDHISYYTPASLPGVLTVGSVNESLNKSDFSNYGEELDLVAPGEHILSSVPASVGEAVYATDPYGVELENGSYYAYYDGTSMATPFVAGVAALLKAQDNSLSAAEISHRLISTAKDLGASGLDNDYGYGLVDAYAALAKSLIIHSPYEGQKLWGKVTITLEVMNPEEGEPIALSVVKDNEETLIGSIPMEAGKTVYNFTWDTTSVTTLIPDGFYTLTAKIGQDYSDEVKIEVANQVESGLQLSVINPDGKAAVDAYVLVVHKGYWDVDTHNEGMWYDIVYRGWTDEDGYLRVPGSIALDGENYEVYVISQMEDVASEGIIPVLYHRSIEGPTLQVIDGTNAQKIAFNLKDREDNPLSDAWISVDFYDEQGYSQWSFPLGLTDGNGQLTAYIDEGSYGFEAAAYNAADSNDYALILGQTDIGVNDEIQNIYFDLENTGELTVSSTDVGYLGAYINLIGSSSFFIEEGESVIVTKGSYNPQIVPHVSDSSNYWAYYFEPQQEVNITAGITTLNVGGDLTAQITSDSTNNVKGDWFYGDSFFTDENGNRLIDIYVGDFGLDSYDLTSYAFKGKDGHIQFLQWDRTKPLNEAISISASLSGWINPILRITTKEGAQVVSKSLLDHYYYFDCDTEDFDSGDYKAQMSLDAGPLGEVDSNTIDFKITEAIADETVTSQVYDLNGDPADYPYFEIVDPTGEWYEYVFAAQGDSDGIVDISDLNLDPDKTYYLIVRDNEEDKENPAIYWKEIKGNDDLSEIDLSKAGLQKVTLKADDPNGNPMKGSSIYVQLVDAAGEIIHTTDYLFYDMLNGMKEIWVTPGTYNFQLLQWAYNNDLDTSFFLVKENESVSEEVYTVTFDSTNTFTVSVDHNLPEGSTLGEAGLIIYSPLFDWGEYLPVEDDLTVALTPGTYDFMHEYAEHNNEGYWYYFLNDKNQHYEMQDTDLELSVGGTYTASLHLDDPELFPGDVLTGDTSFKDQYENQLIGFWVDPFDYWIYSLVIDKERNTVSIHRADKDQAETLKAQGGYASYVNPIFNVYNSNSQQIVHQIDGSYYFSVGQDTTGLSPGNYKAEVVLGAGPSGPVSAAQSFTIVTPDEDDDSPSTGGDSPSTGGGSGGGGPTQETAKEIDKEELTNLIAESGSKPFVIISVTEEEAKKGVQFTTEALNELKKSGKDLLLETDTFSINLPIDSLPFDELEELGETAFLKVKGEEKGSLKDALDHLSSDYHGVSQVINLSIEVYDDEELKSTVTQFSKPVKVQLKLAAKDLAGVNVDLLGAYYLNNGKMEYMGGTYLLTSGTFEFYTSHFSKYVVAEYKKEFKDVPASFWGLGDIQFMASHHIVNGMTDTTFEPNSHVTRAQFASLIARTLGLEDLSEGVSLPDVPNNAWYASSVKAVAALGIVKGDEKGNFRPNDLITRQEMALMISRALEWKKLVSEEANEQVLSNFEDLEQIADWAKEGFEVAVEKGIINGQNGNKLAPHALATRAEATVMLKRLFMLLQ